MLELIQTVHNNHALRISTGVLNEVLIEATAMQQPPADKGRQLRLYYMTQVSVKPLPLLFLLTKSCSTSPIVGISKIR